MLDHVSDSRGAYIQNELANAPFNPLGFYLSKKFVNDNQPTLNTLDDVSV